ncbi:MAG: STAS domain-containing protein [Deltaproteobacteria bacterium]|nr:STAS domain-containing protein [Deltaproteobacteria bacterium]
MNIDATIEKGACMVRIEGEMTIYNAFDIKRGLGQCLGSAGEIRIDLSQVIEMDTSGVQLLLLAKREARRLKRGLKIVSHSQATRSVYELYNLAHHFEDLGA